MQGGQPNPAASFSNLPQTIAIGVLIYLMLTNFFVLKVNDTSIIVAETGDDKSQVPGVPGSSDAAKPQPDLSLGTGPHSNVWKGGSEFVTKVYLREDANPLNASELKDIVPDWHVKRSVYGDFSLDEQIELTITPTEHLYNNGSLYAHWYLCKLGAKWPASALNSKSTACIQKVAPLVIFQAPPPKKVTHQLLGAHNNDANGDDHASTNTNNDRRPAAAADDASLEDEGPRAWISYWKPNMTVNIVFDETNYPRNGIPEQVKPFMTFTQLGNYFPPLYINDFWVFREHLYPINRTVATLNLTLNLYTLAPWKWLIYRQMSESFETQVNTMGTSNPSEIDEFKRMLVETNPYLLALTFVVSVLHMVFDMLAFKNDITFWKDRKSTTGLSVRSIFLNTFCQVIIFLYLLDNETTWMIVLSSGVGCLIEFWKIKQVCSLNRKPTFPYISFEERRSSSKTRRFDEQAMKYLSWALFPLVAFYGVYTLIYEEHKGWYSWLLSTLTGAVYTFGFIMMTPQLFINYKHKSVKHLPWKVFTYKALNTFIDDLFAFIIKMPTLHRLACFRDDIVFFIYLYQRWIYRDNTRLAEDDEDEDGEEEEEEENDSSSTNTTTPSEDAPDSTPLRSEEQALVESLD